MPSRDLHVQDIVLEVLDVLQVFGELFLKLKKVLSVSVTHDATELWHHLLGPFSGKLKLTLAYLHQVSAPLNERLILSKDGVIVVECPMGSPR